MADPGPISRLEDESTRAYLNLVRQERTKFLSVPGSGLMADVTGSRE